MKTEKLILINLISLIFLILSVSFVSAGFAEWWNRIIGVQLSPCEGCEYDSRCYQIGDELVIGSSPSYCDLSKQILLQKSDGGSCNNNFECLNNYCSNGKCVDIYKEVEGKREVIEEIGGGVKRIDAYVSIATLKDSYSIGEQVKLTDPPESVSDNMAGVLENIDGNLMILRENPDNGEIERISREDYNISEEIFESLFPELKFKGYIIQFEQEPVVVRKVNLEKKMEKLDKQIKEAIPVIGFIPNIIRKIQKTGAEKDLENLGEYREKLKENRAKILAKASGKIGKSITGKAVENFGENNIELMNEFSEVFNGVALDISDAEAEEIKKLDGIKTVSPNLEVQTTLMNSVPLINADDVWRLDRNGNNCEASGQPCLTGEGVSIAIIDTGIDYTHADLGGCFGVNCKVVGGYDFVNDDRNPMDDHGHGTHVAGIAAGNGVLKGVAPDAKLYGYKVLNSGGSGYFSWIIAGIERAVLNEVDVISMSLGARCNKYDENCGPDDDMSQAVDNSVDSGVVVVVSAGNSGPRSGSIGSPGTARKAITIGATYKKDYEGNYWSDTNPRKDQITSFSSRGPVLGNVFGFIKPDVVAPGAIICSAQWDGAWDNRKCDGLIDEEHIQISGTSMATPMVAGAVALLKQKNPGWIPEEIKTVLKNTANDLEYRINDQGAGRINLERAINLIDRPPIAIIETAGKVGGAEVVDIIGTATGENFESYTIFYLSKEDFDMQNYDWVEIYNSFSPVNNDILHVLDIASLIEKDYVLFLVVNANNQESKAYSFIKIVNTEIESPISIYEYDAWVDDETVVHRFDQRLIIKGTAQGYNFDYYTIEWCNMDYVCSTEGITLSNNGQQPVIQDVLGYWDMPADIEAGYYYLELSNLRIGYEVKVFRVKIYVETELQQGWPRKIGVEGSGGLALSFIGQPTIEDVDEDGKNDIIIAYGNHILVYDYKGDYLDGFPVETQHYNMQRGAAVADINNDGHKEIVVGDNGGWVYVLRRDGTYLEGWPKYFRGYIDLVSLEDITNDGNLEIIFGSSSGIVNVVDINGNYLPGWPTYLTGPPGYVYFKAVRDGISVADLNKDGNKEIVANLFACDQEGRCSYDEHASASVYVLDKEGKVLPGWPKSFINPLSSKISIVDIDKDGNLDVLFTHQFDIHALDYLGNYLEGFPFTLGNDLKVSSAIVGDLDKDNVLDIVIGARTDSGSDFPHKDCLYIIDENLIIKPGFPICYPDYIGDKRVYIGFYNVGLQAGNLDGYVNQIGVASRSNWRPLELGELYNFYIFNPDGTLPSNSPKIIDSLILGDSTPIGDLDNDGDNEVMVYTFKGNLFIWDLKGDPKTNEWPMFQHDPQHTGNYHFIPPRPQSKAVNNAEEDLTAKLIIKIQKKTGEVWNDYSIPVNEEVLIPGGRLLKLDTGKDSLGNQVFAGFNNLDVKINEAGEFRVYVALASGGIVLRDLNEELIEASYEFGVV